MSTNRETEPLQQPAARGSIAVAQAKAYASDVAVAVASDLFSMSGVLPPNHGQL
jgi:hypothetical protein